MRGCAGAGALVPVSTAPRRLTRSRYSLEHSRVFHSGADAPNGRARREQARMLRTCAQGQNVRARPKRARERRPVWQVGAASVLGGTGAKPDRHQCAAAAPGSSKGRSERLPAGPCPCTKSVLQSHVRELPQQTTSVICTL